MVFVKYAILKHLSQISLAARLVKDIWRKTRSTDSIGKTQSKMNAHIGFPLKMAETTLGARRWATLFAQPGRHQSPKMHNVLSPLMGVHSLFVCRVCLRALSHQCVNVFHARLAPWNVFVLSSLCQPSSSPDDCQDPVARTWLNLCLSNLCVSCLLVCFVTPIFFGHHKHSDRSCRISFLCDHICRCMGKQTKHKSNLSSIILQAFDSEDIPEDEGEGAVEGAQDFENAFEEGAEEEPEENGEESWSAFFLFKCFCP